MKTKQNYVIGNWKMHLDVTSAKQLVNHLLMHKPDNANLQIGVAPSFMLIPAVYSLLKDSHIKLLGQNCAKAIEGAYTGETSIKLLAEYGCDFCLIGHSERRKLFFEANDVIGDKAKLVLQQGLQVVLCVGETLSERQARQHWSVIESQLMAVYSKIEHSLCDRIVIAYEPVWAIGTGQTATVEQAQEVHSFIRSLLAKKVGQDSALTTSILYGGSVKASNAAQLFAANDIDGFLVGGASLVAEEFQKIIDKLN